VTLLKVGEHRIDTPREERLREMRDSRQARERERQREKEKRG
jgi:hypothetical protein